MEAPEAWVGKDANLRAEAANVCKTACPVFEQCKAGTFPFIKPGPDDHGVWAGRDLTNEEAAVQGRACAVCGKVNRSATGQHPRKCATCLETKHCQRCEDEFPRTYHSDKTWESAKFCSTVCANTPSNDARKTAAA